MTRLLDNPKFAAAYQRLASVSLNPRRHTAANAHAHSEAVAARAASLARANGVDAALLEDLGRAHDIGKITGTARPEKSLEVLADCDITDPQLLALVKWHDTNLPWFNANKRGQPPSEKAWRRLAADVDVRTLALFMVADRVDAPPGWRRNAPLVWFLDQARERGLVGELALDQPGYPAEVSAGAVLVDRDRALVIRVRAEGFEIPKGGIEWDELPEEAAMRELAEESGARGAALGGKLGHVTYGSKRVDYWRATGGELGALPDRTRERRWITAGELATLPLVNADLRAILQRALTL
jgi:ADP-ribose pyrophosphatase YjhB (NUDIX family)